MNDLLSLRLSSRFLNPEVASYIKSEAFAADVARLRSDDVLRARLTVRLLEGIAVDPLSMARGETFFVHGVLGRDPVWVNIRLDRWVNFLGAFSLANGSAQIQEVMNAIERNLQSPMFEAAKAHRAHDRTISAEHARASELARAAFEEACHGVRRQDLSASQYLHAQETFAKVFNEAMEGFHQRGRDLSAAAAPRFAGVDFTEGVASFLFEHLHEAEERIEG
jgi:hypothetical protein